jgi:hypothetical protein
MLSAIVLVAADSSNSSWVRQMRILRAFRLARVVGKVGELQQVVAAVSMSIVPALHALVSCLLRTASRVQISASNHPAEAGLSTSQSVSPSFCLSLCLLPNPLVSFTTVTTPLRPVLTPLLSSSLYRDRPYFLPSTSLIFHLPHLFNYPPIYFRF